MKVESFIAIDNVCAWPNLTLLPNGSIAAVIFNKPNHGITEGGVDCWVSDDQGYSWRKSGEPGPHQPNRNRMNVSAGLSDSGELIVISSGWDNVVPYDKQVIETCHGTRGKILDPVISRSADGGRTWIQGGSVEMPEDASAIVPFGDIVSNGQGVLGSSMYSFRKEMNREGKYENILFSYFARSYDQGKSWVEPHFIASAHQAERLHNGESAVLSLGGQRLLAAVRTSEHGEEHLEIFISEDFGLSWASKGAASLPGQIPAHLLHLQDGRILLTYGMRNKGNFGIGARISSDEGTSWSKPVFIVDFETATDGGYPSCVQLADGTLVMGYHA
ncbi:MAG: exo-alpha-sialidase, partial [Cohnella sp.]|nr:exo-alpha-sialidase [Cohnella sp.]